MSYGALKEAAASDEEGRGTSVILRTSNSCSLRTQEINRNRKIDMEKLFCMVVECILPIVSKLELKLGFLDLQLGKISIIQE